MALVNYKDQQLELKSGDIILYRNEFDWKKPITYLAFLVRLFTRCRYNHAAIIVSNWDQLMINEALGKGVVSRPVKFLDRGKSFICIRRAKEGFSEKDFCIKANNALGKLYDFKFTFLDQLWFRVSGWHYTGHSQNFADSRFACAEYCSWIHNRPYWNYASAKEILLDDYFSTVFEEL